MSVINLKSTVLYDLTWFISSPVRTGMQRYLYELARNWPIKDQLLPVLIDEHATMRLVSPDVFTLMEMFFAADITLEAQDLADRIKALGAQTLCKLDGELIADATAVLLPEVTFNWNQIWFYIQTIRIWPEKLFFLTYDFIPWLSPDYFPHLDCSQPGVVGYLRLLTMSGNLGFLSERTKTTFETRVLKGHVQNPVVLGGGSDAFDGVYNAPDPTWPHFVCIGTIQLRKQHFLILDVFTKLWEEGIKVRLTFVGTVGNVGSSELDRLNQCVEEQECFCWEQEAADAEIREILIDATVTLYPSAEEGLGLPLLESIRAGIPAIVSKDLPALEFVPANGIVAIAVKFDALETAVRSFLDPEFARDKRVEIDKNAAPRWRDVARQAYNWIHTSTVAWNPDIRLGTDAILLAGRLRYAGEVAKLDKLDGAKFVEACVKRLFGRVPSGAEIMEWLECLNIVTDRKLDILSLMVNCNEYVQGYGLEACRAWLLGRMLYDGAPELNYSARSLQPSSSANVHMKSAGEEIVERLLQTEDMNFLQACYLQLLGRNIDSSGLETYSKIMSSNLTSLNKKSRVIFGISTSAEFINKKGRMLSVEIVEVVSNKSGRAGHSVSSECLRLIAKLTRGDGRLTRVIAHEALRLNAADFTYFIRKARSEHFKSTGESLMIKEPNNEFEKINLIQNLVAQSDKIRYKGLLYWLKINAARIEDVA